MKRKRNFFQNERPPEYLRCNYRGVDIDLSNLIKKAGEQVKQSVEVVSTGSVSFIRCFTPGISLSALWISVFNLHNIKNLFHYQVELRLPCNIEDVRLFCAVSRLLKAECRSKGWHSQMVFDSCNTYPGGSIINNEEDTLKEWRKGMTAFFEQFAENDKTFSVHNGRLSFVFSYSRFNLPQKDKKAQEAILLSVLHHIWQPLYQQVDPTSIFVEVHTESNFKTRQMLNCVPWTNQSPLLTRFDSYLAVEYPEGWKVIRPKRWKRLLEPFFIQYDDVQKNLIPILRKEQFEKLKAELHPLASLLRMTVFYEDNSMQMTAEVLNSL